MRIVSVSSKENAIVQYSQFKILSFQKWNNQIDMPQKFTNCDDIIQVHKQTPK